MFNRDSACYRMSPRTLQTSKFGPYSTLDVGRKHGLKQWVWAIALGMAIGAGWYIWLGLWVGP